MLFVRLTTCWACLLVSCADIVGVEDWSPIPPPVGTTEGGVSAPDGAVEAALGDDAGKDAALPEDAASEAESSLPGLCEGGAWRCVQAELLHCEGSPGHWTSTTVCETPALCSSTQGLCKEPVCAVGEYKCEGTKLLACSSGRDGWDMKKNCVKQVCDAVNARCSTCQAGSMTCAGAELRRCTQDGEGTELVETCAAPQLCDAALGQCGPGPDL